SDSPATGPYGICWPNARRSPGRPTDGFTNPTSTRVSGSETPRQNGSKSRKAAIQKLVGRPLKNASPLVQPISLQWTAGSATTPAPATRANAAHSHRRRVLTLSPLCGADDRQLRRSFHLKKARGVAVPVCAEPGNRLQLPRVHLALLVQYAVSDMNCQDFADD